MKKILFFLAFAAVMVFSLTPAMAVTTLSFFDITNNVGNLDLSGQLFVDVYLNGESAPNPAGGTVAIGVNQAGFYFRNTGPLASNVSEIYFDDGTLISGPTIFDNPPTVDFALGASPSNLPGGNNISPAFVATVVFNSSAINPAPQKGIAPFEALLLTFSTSGDPLAGLTDGSLRIGMHVTGIAGTTGGSDSYVNNPVPLPGAVLLLGAGLARLAAYARRRQED